MLEGVTIHTTRHAEHRFRDRVGEPVGRLVERARLATLPSRKLENKAHAFFADFRRKRRFRADKLDVGVLKHEHVFFLYTWVGKNDVLLISVTTQALIDGSSYGAATSRAGAEE
jgi:hypothetical protein